MPGKSWSWTKRLRYALPRRLGSAWHALSLGIVPLVTSQSWLQALEEQRFPEKDPATEDENNDTEAEAEASSSKTVRFKKGRLKISSKTFLCEDNAASHAASDAAEDVAADASEMVTVSAAESLSIGVKPWHVVVWQ